MTYRLRGVAATCQNGWMKHNLAAGWAIAALSLPAVSFAQTFPFERTVPVTAVVTRIDVTTDNGSVHIGVGEADHIVVTGTVKLRRGGFVLPVEAPELAKAVADKPPVSGEGNTVFLRQPADRVTREGLADEGIAEEAAAWEADVTVVGSHGKGWMDRMLIGSTTERLVNRLPTSLLVVPILRRTRRRAVRPRQAGKRRASGRKGKVLI